MRFGTKSLQGMRWRECTSLDGIGFQSRLTWCRLLRWSPCCYRANATFAFSGPLPIRYTEIIPFGETATHSFLQTT